MITLINNPDTETILRRLNQGKYARGTVLEYFQGDFSSNVNQTSTGRDMYDMRDKVTLYQKLMKDEPRRYSYQGVVK